MTQLAERATTIVSTRTAARDRTFFLVMAFAATATVFFGFAPSYYLKSVTHTTHFPAGQPVSSSLSTLVHAHALLFSAWMVLFLAQNLLVTTGRVGVHRKMGIAGAVLVPVMTILGVLTAIRGAKDGWNPGGPFQDSLAFMIVGLTDIFVFASFAAAGLYYRRRPEIHKRLMLLATLGGLMWPAITRMPLVAGRPALMWGLLLSLVLATAVRDRLVYSRFHPASLGGAILILASFPIRVLAARSDTWHSFAAWLISTHFGG